MKIILGIDPGTRYSGYAIMRMHERQAALLAHGCFVLGAQKPLPVRVHSFYQSFTELIHQFQVNTIALETPFLGKNAQNFLKLGYLRGIVYLLTQQHHIDLVEFSPREIKQGVTGFGGASKDQVSNMVRRLFPRLANQEMREDVTDALAIALCGVWQSSLQSRLTTKANNLARHCIF